MDLTYFGHSTFQLETGGTTILVDPFLTENPHTDVSPDALNPDVLLLTHAHFDHVADAPEIARRSGALVVANFEMISYFQQEYGHENVHPLNEGGRIDFDWGSVEAVHARHSSSFPDGTYGGTPVGHLLHLDDTCLYNAGDTAPFAEMQWIGDEHSVDVALLPVGGVVTMGADGAVRTAELIDPMLTVPLHYGTFPFIAETPEAWSRQMDAAGFDTRTLDAGETMEL